jgi:hypothetical protein
MTGAMRNMLLCVLRRHSLCIGIAVAFVALHMLYWSVPALKTQNLVSQKGHSIGLSNDVNNATLGVCSLSLILNI